MDRKQIEQQIRQLQHDMQTIQDIYCQPIIAEVGNSQYTQMGYRWVDDNAKRRYESMVKRLGELSLQLRKTE